MSAQPTSNGQSATWHHKGPVKFSPVFEWPPRPLAALRALGMRWVTLSRNVLFLLLAIAVYQWLLPPMSAMAELSWQWVLPIFVRNLVLMLLFAGGLHYYLFVRQAQGKQTKFVPRDKMEPGKQFTFGHQTYDNMFWSLASGVTIWTIYEVLYFWGVANGVIPTLGFTDHPIAFVAWLFFFPLIIGTHFFLVHTLLHWPPLFQSVHKLHHRNIHVGPWSGMSMHPVEHILYISSVLIHFVIASHPVIFLLHIYWRCLTPAFSHAGFQQLYVGNKMVTESADFHHQLHHKYFECNYGNVDVAWDKWFGLVHDGSDAGTKAVQQRRRDMYRRRAA